MIQPVAPAAFDCFFSGCDSVDSTIMRTYLCFELVRIRLIKFNSVHPRHFEVGAMRWMSPDNFESASHPSMASATNGQQSPRSGRERDGTRLRERNERHIRHSGRQAPAGNRRDAGGFTGIVHPPGPKWRALTHFYGIIRIEALRKANFRPSSSTTLTWQMYSPGTNFANGA